MNLRRGPRPRQGGNALVLGLIALVLAAIGIGIGVNQYKRAERSAAILQTVADINAIVGETKAVYGRYGYKGLTLATGLGAGIIPARFITTNGGASAPMAINQFGGRVDVGVVTGSAVNSGFVSYMNIPSDLCQSIVTQTEKQAWGVIVNGTLIKYSTPPMQKGFALEQLGAACTDPANLKQILWYFG